MQQQEFNLNDTDCQTVSLIDYALKDGCYISLYVGSLATLSQCVDREVILKIINEYSEINIVIAGLNRRIGIAKVISGELKSCGDTAWFDDWRKECRIKK